MLVSYILSSSGKDNLFKYFAAVYLIRCLSSHIPCNTPPLTGKKPTLAKLSMMKSATGEKIKIIESLAPKWKELGALLDFDPEGRTLALIEANNKLKGPTASCQEMFVTWLQGKGVEVTWKVLIELLDKVDQSELAKRVKTALH